MWRVVTVPARRKVGYQIAEIQQIAVSAVGYQHTSSIYCANQRLEERKKCTSTIELLIELKIRGRECVKVQCEAVKGDQGCVTVPCRLRRKLVILL